MSELFDGLVGQPLAVHLLEAALQQNRLAPAYLFAGPDGVGRRFAALRFLEGVLSGGVGCDRARRRLEGKEPSRRFLVDWMQRKAQREQTQRENDRAGLELRPFACTWPGCDYTTSRK